MGYTAEELERDNPYNAGLGIDFDSDEPLVCSRDQSGDTTCESCQ